MFNRGEHPMMVFDRDGNFLRAWGEGLFPRAHGLHMAPDDTVFLTDDGDHSVRQCTLDGKVLLTLGTPGKPAPFMSGEPFHRCTHTALSPKGEIYVSDGYGNARVHKYAPDGKHADVVGRIRHRARASSTWCTTYPAIRMAGSTSRIGRTTASRCSTATAATKRSSTTCIARAACSCRIAPARSATWANWVRRHAPIATIQTWGRDCRSSTTRAICWRASADSIPGTGPDRLHRPARALRRFPWRHLHRRGLAHVMAAVLRGPAGTRRRALPAQAAQDQLTLEFPPCRMNRSGSTFSIPVRINLSSDTQTKPTRAMKEAMMEAEVGDEQMGSDPTIWALCDRTAALLGKEAAVFLPSGTMCNQVAIATHCRPGEEILAHESSHILSSEGGAPAAIAGALIKGLTGERGQFTVDTLEDGDPAGVALFADATPGGGGADREPWRRRVLERRGAARGDRGGACARAVDAHGWRTADECRGGARRAGTRPHRRLRFGLARFHQGPGCAFGRRAGRVAASSSARRGVGSSGSAARCVRAASAPPPASMRSSTTSIGWPRITPTPSRWRAAWHRFPASRWRCRKPTWCSSIPQGTGMTVDAFAGKLRKEGVLVSTSGKYRGRACLHLDVTAAQVDEALSVMKQVVNAG